MDPLVDALRRLVGDSAEKRQEVADTIGCNEQTLYQIVRGIALKSGKPRGVGRKIREGLDTHYPGWRVAPVSEPVAPHQVVPQPSLPAALRTLGDVLAAEMPADVRDDIADALRKLAMRRGTARDQQQVLQLLSNSLKKAESAAA